MDNYKKKEPYVTEKKDKMMVCANCGFPVVQTEVVENYGNCPNCDKEFKPFNKPDVIRR
jgi:rubrerythrin